MLNFLKPAADAATKVPDEKISSKYKIWQLRVLTSSSIVYVGYYIIRLIFTTQQNDIRQAYGFSLSQIGLILSTFGIGYGIAKLVMGTLADRSNANRYVATGLMVSSIINLFLGSTQNFYVIIVLMLLNSFMQGMGAAGCQRLISLWFGRKATGSIMARGTAYSIWSSAHNLGAFMCVATVNLSALFFGHSLQFSFYTASVVSFIIALFTWFVGSDRPASKGLPSIEQYSQDELVKSDEAVTDLPVHEVFVKYILKNKLVWAVILTSLSIYIVRYGIMSWIPSYLTEFKGFKAADAKWLVGIFELSAVPGVIILGFISDLLKGRRAIVLIIALIGMVISLTTYFFATNHTLIVVMLLILGTLIYAPATIVGLMVNEAVPKFAVGMSTGSMGIAQYLIGEVVGTAVIGIAVDHYGWQAGNVVLYIAAAIAIICSLYIAKVQQKTIK